jgi:hypothetical protein
MDENGRKKIFVCYDDALEIILKSWHFLPKMLSFA